MRVRHVLLALVVFGAGDLLRAQSPSSPLVLLATVGEYPGETYTTGPLAPAEFVVFEGEPLAVDVSVANWSSRRAGLQLPASPRPLAEAVVRRDGQPTMHARLLDRLWRETVGGSERAMPSATMVLEPGDGLRWRLMVDTTALEPGFHVVRVDTGASDEAGASIRRQRSEFTIEMRARSEALPAELARRAAEWLTAEGEVAKARAATDELERVYPDSVAVHLIRSRLADAEGDDRRARWELDEAAAFMRADRDTLFRRFARPGQIEDLIDSLRP